MNTVANLSNELDKLQAQRRDLVAQRSQLEAQRDGADLPQDIDKAADMLLFVGAKIDAATRIIADVDAKIDDVTARRDAAQLEANKAEARRIDGEIATVEADLVQALDRVAGLIDAHEHKNAQRAQVLGKVAYPSGKFVDLRNAIITVKTNAGLAAAFSQK